jgi:transposase-like protein
LALFELSVVEQRYRAVLDAAAGVPVIEVAERYGVSRQSVDAWVRLIEDGRRRYGPGRDGSESGRSVERSRQTGS